MSSLKEEGRSSLCLVRSWVVRKNQRPHFLLEGRSTNTRIRRSFLRLFFCWYFASLAMIFLCGTLACVLPKSHGGDGLDRPGNPLAGGLVVSVYLVLTIIFGVAGWTAFRDSTSAIMRRRGWMVIASLLNLLISTGIPLFYWHAEGVTAFWSLAGLFEFPAVVGGAGLIAFTHPNKHTEPHPM